MRRAATGLREAADAVEREGVRRARRSVAGADLLLLVVDVQRALDWLGPDGAPPAVDRFVSEQLAALQLTAGGGADGSPPPETRLVLNKLDLAPPDAAERLAVWAAGGASLVSCLTGAGLAALADTLGRRLGGLCADAASPAPALTRQRHRQHVAACERHVRRFVAQVSAGGDLALAAEQLRLAARQLGAVTGHVAAEEILDVIFSDFCIGK